MSTSEQHDDDATIPAPSSSIGSAKDPVLIDGLLSPPYVFAWEYDPNPLDYVIGVRSPEARDFFLESLGTAVDKVPGLHPSIRAAISLFWRASLLAFSEGPTWDRSTMEDLRESLHPLIYALVAGGGITSFDASRDTLWFQNGKWRNKRPDGTGAQPRSRTTSQTGGPVAPVVVPPPINFEFSGIPTDDGHPDWHDEDDEPEVVLPASPPRIPSALEGKSTVSRLTAAAINQAAAASHSANFFNDFDRAHEGIISTRGGESSIRPGGLSFDNSDVDSLWAGLDQRIQDQKKILRETPHQRGVNTIRI
ncbi:hypothetical protein P7C70_g8540, partial [Phenoliferia sp. Uapishka_3]